MKKQAYLALTLGLGLTAAFATPANTYVAMVVSPQDTLDPSRSYVVRGLAIIENVYETLVTYKGRSTTEF